MSTAKKNKNSSHKQDVTDETMDIPKGEDAAGATSGQPSEGTPETPAQEQLETKLLRLQADFDNYRKRIVKEKAEWNLRAVEDVLVELLPVIDHFEMGLNTASADENTEALLTGFRLVYDQLCTATKRFGLTPMDAVGKEFDPHSMDAVTYIPSDSVPAEQVIEQLRRGYLLGERLIRPAQVVVSSGMTATDIEA